MTQRWPNSIALSICNQITRRRGKIAAGYIADRADGNNSLVKRSWPRNSIHVMDKFQQTSRSDSILREWNEAERYASRALALDPNNFVAIAAQVNARLNGSGDIEGARQARAAGPERAQYLCWARLAVERSLGQPVGQLFPP